MPSGIFKAEWRRRCLHACRKLEIGSWKLSEIKLAKKWIKASSDTWGERRKREKSQRALLAGGEKCCKLTELFLKSSAAWASTSANTASTNVSNTAEPAHQGERQDREEYEAEEEQNEQEEDEEVDMDNKSR